ncbi:MAG TPA: serine/threonine-protein kinase [Gaiellales bacterium]|nr:serine/threonine-protein kinase [Gaiellales bacterium]
MPPALSAQLPPRYANPRPLSAGGMGEILLVDDTLLARPVVLKLLAETYARDELLRRRFLREANAAARLSGHPHVVTIYDVGEWDGRPFIAMEYLPNGDLHRRLLQGRPPFDATAAWMAEAASALDAAHRSGIVHRDVKPANLLLDARCSVHVADFGIARVVDSLTTAVTMPGTVMGTAGYISPEQARGEPAGGASDIYSLGAVAYELVTGRRPFAREGDADEVDAHLHAPLPPASASADVPRAADAVFARAMAKSPANRYPTAEAFADDLAAALGRTDQPTAVMVPAAAPGRIATYGGRAPSRRRPVGLLVGVLALLALAGGLAAAYAVSHGGGSSAPRMQTITRHETVERVVTSRGATVTVPATTTRTVTVPATSPAPAGGGAAEGHALNDRGYAAMQRGDYAGALPSLRRAVADLRGAGPGDPYEAYANYNLGYTLLQLGRCGEAIAPLERAQQLETSPAVPAALARARACA